jgi:hypothetical protein
LFLVAPNNLLNERGFRPVGHGVEVRRAQWRRGVADADGSGDGAIPASCFC